ncbi:MAG: ABC transporter substrate-binding protein [Patescibacteria group bacterium]
MNNATKTIIGLVVLALIIWGGYSFWSSALEEGEGEVIKIGAILPFTGSSGITGESSRNGLELALQETNDLGGIDGKEIKLIYEDSQTKTDIGLTAFQKLKDIDKIKIVFTSVSGVALAISPLANSNQIIQMDIVAASPNYATPNDFTFRTGVNSYLFAEKMSSVLIDKEIKEVALLFVNSEYGVGYKDVFVREYERLGGKIKIIESFNQGEKDFRTQLLKIKDKQTAILVLISLQKETPPLLKQMDELNFNIPIYTDVYTAELSENLGARNAENMIYLKPIVDFGDKENLIANKFREDYLKKYNTEPDFMSAQGYDGLRLLVEAMGKCENLEDTECIKNNLYKITDFQGAIGKNLSFDANGEITDRSLELKTIKNGEFVPYEE